MKKLFLSAAMAVFSLGTFAQSAVGSVTLQPKVGLNIACLTDEDNATSRIGFTGGAELGYQATKNPTKKKPKKYEKDKNKKGAINP